MASLSMTKEQAQTELETKVLRQIVSMKPGRVNPSQAAVLQEILRRFDESSKDVKASEVVQLKEFGETKEMVNQYLSHVRRATLYRAAFGRQLLMPGTNKWKSTTSIHDPSGILKLPVPEDVEVMPLTSVEIMLLDSGAEEVELLELDDDRVEDEPVEAVLLQFPDETESNKKHVSTWTTASVSVDLNRWAGSKLVVMPRIDHVVPLAAAGHQPVETITLVGRFFSTEREQNTIQLMKRMADGSVGVLVDLKPVIASTAGTALEMVLPDDLRPAQFIVRVVVDKDGDLLTSNPYELNASLSLSAAPVVTKISPDSQAPSEMITIEGNDFGDAALVELWFHPKSEPSLPTVLNEDRTAFAEVRSDTQLVAQVPSALVSGDYVVACNRNGRLSNWVDFKVP